MEPIERPGADTLTWSNPSSGLWVASTPTRYLGMVDGVGGRFAASGTGGVRLGVYDTQHAAKIAVQTAHGRPGKTLPATGNSSNDEG